MYVCHVFMCVHVRVELNYLCTCTQTVDYTNIPNESLITCIRCIVHKFVLYMNSMYLYDYIHVFNVYMYRYSMYMYLKSMYMKSMHMYSVFEAHAHDFHDFHDFDIFIAVYLNFYALDVHGTCIGCTCTRIRCTCMNVHVCCTCIRCYHPDGT